jgi:restriction system protein
MQGTMYELHCADILKKHGWTTKLTKGSGDQGVDILAQKNDVIVALQCKKYAKPVGNKAVQEAFTGMQYSRANFSAVVTNAGYTKAAQDAARNTGTFLLRDMDLPQLEALITTKSARAK